MKLEIDKAPYLYRKVFRVVQEHQKESLYGLKSSELVKILSSNFRLTKKDVYLVIKELKDVFSK